MDWNRCGPHVVHAPVWLLCALKRHRSTVSNKTFALRFLSFEMWLRVTQVPFKTCRLGPILVELLFSLKIGPRLFCPYCVCLLCAQTRPRCSSFLPSSWRTGFPDQARSESPPLDLSTSFDLFVPLQSGLMGVSSFLEAS